MTLSPRRAGVVLVAVHLGLVGYGAYIHFPTRNEVAHVPAGLAVWATGRFPLYRVNPPLPRLIASLPVLAAGPNMAMLRPTDTPGRREEWDAARDFADGNPFRYLALMRLARLPGLCWSAAGAWVVWRWGRDLYGPRAALIGLGIWCLGPTVNAHAQLATPDFPAAVAALVATYVFRGYLREPSVERAAWAGVALGAAQLCKFTLLALYPAWVLVAMIWLRRATPPRLARAGAHAVVGGLVSLVVLNSGYGGDGTLTPLGEYQFTSKLLRGSNSGDGVGNRFAGTWLGGMPVPLPYDYVSGIDTQRVDFEGGRKSYLRGEWADRGWWYFYVYAVLIKTPTGVLALALGSALAALRRPTAEGAVLWVPAVVLLAAVSSQTGMTQHSRYVLPALPFVVVAMSQAGTLLGGRWWHRGVVAVLGGWAVVSTAAAYPHTLSYANECAGGPSNAWRHLADSNVDWGQDLLLLQRWIGEHPDARPIFIGYENFVDYRHAGFELTAAPTDLPAGADAETLLPRDLTRYGPTPGYFAIDVYNLTEGERTFFRRFGPVARVGYSIFLYHITPATAAAARREMGLPPLP